MHTFRLSFDSCHANSPTHKGLCPWGCLQRDTRFAAEAALESCILCRERNQKGVHEKEERPCGIINILDSEVTCGEGRTGWPPMRETAASLMSLTSSTTPSGTPRSTLVSTPARSSSSESDQSSTRGGMSADRSRGKNYMS